MMSDVTAKVVQWLTAQGRRAGVVCSRVELAHLNGDMSWSRIGGFDVVTLDDVELGEVSANLCRLGMEHAEDMPGPQVYELRALWSSGDKLEAHSTMPLRLEGRTLEGVLSPTEAATATGQIQQQMRHNESQQRVNAMLTGQLVGLLAKQLERADRRIEHLETQRAASLEQVEAVALNYHQREIEKLQAERSERRKDEGLQTLKMLAPTVGAGVAKKLGMGVEVTRNLHTEGLTQFLKTLSYPQFVAIMKTLTPQQQAVWMAAYKELALSGEPEAAAAEPAAAAAADKKGDAS